MCYFLSKNFGCLSYGERTVLVHTEIFMLSTKLITDIHGPQTTYVKDFDPLTFLLVIFHI